MRKMKIQIPTKAELYERINWLIKLRCLAILGVLVTVLATPRLLNIPLPQIPLLSLTAAVGLYNLGFFLYARRFRRREDSRAEHRKANIFIQIQISVDLLALILMLHFSGGVENPFLFYFIFHMIIASILLSRKAAFFQAGFAILLFGAMAGLEFIHFLPHVHLIGFMREELFDQEGYLLGISFVFTTTLLLSVYMASSIALHLRKRRQQLMVATHSLEQRSLELKEAYARLQELDEEKSRFMLTTAHELRSPLATIQSCLKVVLDGYTSTVEEKQKRMITRAEQRIETLLALVNDLLRLARLKEVKDNVKMESLPILEVLRKVLDNERARAEVKGIQLLTDLPEVSPVLISNRERMEQLFANLIGNAVKYTPAGGTVSIKIWEDRDRVRGEISDTGIGIPAGEVSKVFDEFYRTENAKKYQREGTGLGLSIVKRVVETQGGDIRIESEIGKGTTFKFALPKEENFSGVS